MKKYISICLGGLLLLGTAACSGEDALLPDEDTSALNFQPAAGATDAESVLRRNFFSEEGCYLLFNDTLSHEAIGTDYRGHTFYKTEVLDMGYSVGNSTSEQYKKYSYEYLADQAEKESAVAFLKEYVLPHLPANLRPFSWFLVRSIMDNETYESLSALSGQRSIAVAVGYSVADMSDEEKEELTNATLSTTLINSLSSKTSELAAFYEYCQSIYNTMFEMEEYTMEENMELLKQAGFIKAYTSWGFELMSMYPTSEQDVEAFVTLVMNNTQEEIEAMYEGYPIVIEKAAVMSRLITELGYIY